MTAPTLTLADFLLARIAEEEAEVARWQAAMEADEVAAVGVPSWVVMAGGLKIPARVLAECEAKRRIVEQCRIALDRMCLPLTPGSGRTGEYAVASLTLGFLALPYADHPDFREDWRP